MSPKSKTKASRIQLRTSIILIISLEINALMADKETILKTITDKIQKLNYQSQKGRPTILSDVK